MTTLLPYAIAAASLLGVVVRPWRSPEAVWAVVGAAAMVAFGPVPWRAAWDAVGEGLDVYLFLIGMMLLSALAEREGLFDSAAALCVRRARGSAARLFALVYATGVVVTVFMSNDATAVVLTPAVLAVCRRAKARPLPYLMACALIANAASFVLPISNPANLVVFADRMPSLASWLARFALPSALAIAATFAVLRATSRRDLGATIESDVAIPELSAPARIAAAGIVLVAAVLLVASALEVPLGAPTLAAAAAAWLAVATAKRENPLPLLGRVSWQVVPLVAGLFVVVAGLRRAGLLDTLIELLRRAFEQAPFGTAVGAGTLTAFACNLTNNLPAGLVAGGVVAGAGVDEVVRAAVTIGVDLGPNLSVTGSLATILWLVALREKGEHVGAGQFLKIGVVAMPAALLAAYVALWLQSSGTPR